VDKAPSNVTTPTPLRTLAASAPYRSTRFRAAPRQAVFTAVFSRAPSLRVGRPIRVKVHGSVLNAMSRVGLGAAWRQGSEQGLEAEFEIAHGHDAVDSALAELGGQGEDFGGDPANIDELRPNVRTHPLSGWNRPNPGRVHVSYRAVLRGWAFRPASAVAGLSMANVLPRACARSTSHRTS
jgi:hypothetical protein